MTRKIRKTNRLYILVVDDIQINCDLLEFYLRDIARLDFALDGETALQKTMKNSYDAVLLDISLGCGIDGFEVLRRIRRQKGNRKIAVIAVTGSATEFDKDQFLEMGFYEFLPKPVSKKDLLDVLATVFPRNSRE